MRLHVAVHVVIFVGGIALQMMESREGETVTSLDRCLLQTYNAGNQKVIINSFLW